MYTRGMRLKKAKKVQERARQYSEGGERCDDDVVKKEGEKTKQKELRQTRAKTQPQSDLDLCSHLNTHSRVGDITDVWLW